MSGAAAFLNGLANGGRYIQRQKKLDEQESRQTEGYGMAGDHYGTQRDIPAQRSGRQVRRNNSAGTSTGRAVRVNDPVADDLPPHARAFLNAISARESGGAYNVRYSPEGGATYDVESGQHPRIFEKGPEGPSSAAGRYQFTATTWDDTGGGMATCAGSLPRCAGWQFGRSLAERRRQFLDPDRSCAHMGCFWQPVEPRRYHRHL